MKSHKQKKKIPRKTKSCVQKVSETCWVVCYKSESMDETLEKFYFSSIRKTKNTSNHYQTHF